MRLSACRLFGLLLSSYQPEELVSSSPAGGVADKKRRGRGKRRQLQSVEYLLQDTVLKVKRATVELIRLVFIFIHVFSSGAESVWFILYAAELTTSQHRVGKPGRVLAMTSTRTLISSHVYHVHRV